MSNPKLNFKKETSAKKTRSPPKKAKVEQSTPKKKKLKLDADKAAEKNQHLRFGKAELTPDELSRLSKAQKREMYAANAARTAVHREIDQYEEDNVGVQALSEGEKAAGNVRDISKSRYARKLKKKAKVQGKKNSKTAKSSAQEPTASQNAGDSGIGTREGGSNWLSRWRQKHDIRQSYYAAARSGGTAAQTVGSKKAVSGGASAARSGVKRVVDKGKSVVGSAVNSLMTAAKSNAHVLVIVGVFVLLILINHNLVYRVQEDGTCTNHVNSPKTKAGIRIIPMIDEVFDAFLEEYQYQKVIGFCTDEIDGYSGFVFCTGDGKVYLPNAINRTIRSICADYNKEEESKAKEENRDPVLLPKFSCHILRHTFCTRFCENETNLKVIQEIMGHADISTTMDVYAEATQEKKKESMASLQSALLVR